jgi:hypothetical protein
MGLIPVYRYWLSYRYIVTKQVQVSPCPCRRKKTSMLRLEGAAGTLQVLASIKPDGLNALIACLIETVTGIRISTQSVCACSLARHQSLQTTAMSYLLLFLAVARLTNSLETLLVFGCVLHTGKSCTILCWLLLPHSNALPLFRTAAVALLSRLLALLVLIDDFFR